MRLALGAVFTVRVLQEVLEDATFAEGVQTLVDRVGVSVEASAKAALQKVV